MSFREQYPNLEEDVVAPGPTDTELAELRVEVRRLREREAALVAGIALLLNWLDDEFVTAALPFRADEQIDSVRRLAADPSAPATTKERP